MHIYNFGHANSAYGHGRTGIGNAINAYGRNGGIDAGAAQAGLNRGAVGQVPGDLRSLVKRDANNEPAATYEASPRTYANEAPAGSFEEWRRANLVNPVEERIMRTSSGVANAERINNAILPITMSSEDAAEAGRCIDRVFDSIYEKIGRNNTHRKSPLVMYMEFNDPAINDGMPKETAVMLLKFCENAEYLSDQLTAAGQRGQTTMYPKTDTLLSPSDAIELAKSIKQEVDKMRAVLDKCGITKESVKDADVIKQTYDVTGQWPTPEEFHQGRGFRTGFDTRVEDAVSFLMTNYGLYEFNEGEYPGTSADTYKGVVAKLTAYL
jgi:hypothetical protein